MKKIRLLLAIVLFMIVFSFTACDHSLPQTSGTEPNGSGNTVSKYQVGDIVLNDGSYLRDATSVSDEDKEKAIAVIYKVDGAKAYGVGLVHSKAGLAWCLETANGYDINFTELQCTILGNPGDLFEDTDGSDNFEKIGEALIAAGKTDDTKIEGNYPAFEFAKKL